MPAGNRERPESSSRSAPLQPQRHVALSDVHGRCERQQRHHAALLHRQGPTEREPADPTSSQDTGCSEALVASPRDTTPCMASSNTAVHPWQHMHEHDGNMQARQPGRTC